LKPCASALHRQCIAVYVLLISTSRTSWLIPFIHSQNHRPYYYSCRRSGDFHCIMSALLLLLVASLLALPSIHVLARDVDFCFADEDNPYLYMATKTAYHFVHGGKTRFQTVPSKYDRKSWIDLHPSMRHRNRSVLA